MFWRFLELYLFLKVECVDNHELFWFSIRWPVKGYVGL